MSFLQIKVIGIFLDLIINFIIKISYIKLIRKLRINKPIIKSNGILFKR